MFISDESSEPQSVMSEIQEQEDTDSSSDNYYSDVESFAISAVRSSGGRRNVQPPNISNIGLGMSHLIVLTPLNLLLFVNAQSFPSCQNKDMRIVATKETQGPVSVGVG